MWQDLKLGFRSLLKRPGFATAAIATLALGTGASTAIVSVAYGISLRPLPYPESDRLVRIYEANPASGKLKEDVSMATFHAWREGVPSIESAALFGKERTRLLAGTDGRAATLMSVSPAFFEVLGVRPLLGSTFKPERDYTRFTADDDIMLSYAAWQRLFGGQPDAVGKVLEFTGGGDNDFYRVIGVMPESFSFGLPVDGWRPTNIVELPIPRVVRTWRYDRAVARLRPGATIDRARAELDAVTARLAREFPASNGGWTVTTESLHDSIVGNFGRATWLLLAAMAMVLLVTCLNVGGLLVARAVGRERETAVRAALGATPLRLVRLWLAEASLLSVIGSGLGLLLAWSGVSALKAAAPPGIPRLDAVALDLPTLAVAGVSVLVAILAFTLAPVVRSSTLGLRRAPHDLIDGLRGGSLRGQALTRQTTRTLLTVAQCAGAATLVVLGVMLTRSFVKLMSFDLGWNPTGVLSLNAAPPMPRELGRPWHRYVEWSDRLTARLESTPGIEMAAITTQVPLSTQFFASTIAAGRGKGDTNSTRRTGVVHNVSDGYFRLMSVRLAVGRTFGPEDRFTPLQMNDSTNRPERGVAVVSKSAAQTLWPGQSAIGQALWLPDVDVVTWREVVGVVDDTQFHAIGEAPALHVYVPWTQFSTGRPRVVVKATGDAASIAAVVRDVVQSVEPGTLIDQMVPLDALVSRATAQPRFTSRIVAAFGALALLLAAVGIYGTLSHLVGLRRREIGVRLALGASAGGIISGVVRRGVAPAIAGGAIGVAVAVALARTFRALLFGVEPLDLPSFAGGALLLLVVALVAALGPAVRASRVDPVTALRAE